MMLIKRTYLSLLFLSLSSQGWAQDMALNLQDTQSLNKARSLAFDGKHGTARDTLNVYLKKFPENTSARALLARTYSWDGEYDEARKQFNKITSADRAKKDVWIATVKNELYANNNALALGLANKALIYLAGNVELERLRKLAIYNIEHEIYAPYSKEDTIQKALVKSIKPKKSKKAKETLAFKQPEEKKPLRNTMGVTNAFTIFDKIYEPTIYSTVEYKRQTDAGSIIPRINYSNRLKTNGVQYDIDFYPKFSKMFYAYINYGYSNSSIYPNHKAGGDLYANLPGAMEASAGMRFISFDTRDINVITSSVGHYRGNYYFSLRSYITPQSGGLTRVSGNLLVRKYRRDGENYMGLSLGMGYAPEFRQLTLDGVILSETVLYLESQRINFEYQFTPKNTPAIYKSRLGVARQELVSTPGSFFWAISAGFTYKVKF